MLEPRGELDLAQEPLGTEGGGELGLEHLEGDRPVVLEVAGEIDRGHAAAPELALEHVAVAQGVGEERRGDCGHGGARWGDTGMCSVGRANASRPIALA